MAEIYLARVAGAASTDPPLVIKRVLPELCNDPAFVKMFLAEARITAQLVHPNIVSVVEICEEPGNYFYAMEYVRGADLLELMRALSAQQRTMPLECAVAIAIGVCAGLEHAHSLADHHRRPLDIVHRDVSLGNILLGYDGSVKLADFGVMRQSGRAPTEPGILKGKLGYMSPEQASGRAIDHRTDLFALGIVLYEITTGERLFPPADRDEATLARVVRCAITSPSELLFEYPVDLAAIVMTALARNPDERYATARDMKRDLQAWLRVHGKTAAPRMIGDLVARAIPIASPRPRPNDSAELDALVGSLPPLPVSSSEPAPPARPTLRERPAFRPKRVEPKRRSRVPAMAACALALAFTVISAWLGWNGDSVPAEPAAAVTPPVTLVVAIAEPPAAAAEVSTLAAAGLGVRGAVPALVARRTSERVLAALRACYPSRARDRGHDIEVAFDLVDTRIATRVGTKGMDKLPSCAEKAASLLEDQAVVVTITFRPS